MSQWHYTQHWITHSVLFYYYYLELCVIEQPQDNYFIFYTKNWSYNPQCQYLHILHLLSLKTPIQILDISHVSTWLMSNICIAWHFTGPRENYSIWNRLNSSPRISLFIWLKINPLWLSGHAVCHNQAPRTLPRASLSVPT